MGWHIVITEEMRAAGLSGNELIVYALINGFSQKGQGCFYGSLSYISDACGIARRTAINTLQSLVSKGLIEKKDQTLNGVHFVSYNVTDTAEFAQVVQKLHGGSANFAPNNKEDNRYINISNTIKSGKERFDFLKALIEIGVTEDVAATWMRVRKNKRATNSELAFDELRREINKAGITANDAVKLSAANSWAGFRAEWVNKGNAQQRKETTPRAKESVFAHNMRVINEILGNNPAEGVADEQ